MERQKRADFPTGASLIVLEQNEVRIIRLDERSKWQVGRHHPGAVQDPEICFFSRIVSRSHGWIINLEGNWYYTENPDNTNGTYLNDKKIMKAPDKKSMPVQLRDGDILRIDHKNLNFANTDGVLMRFTTEPIRGKWVITPLEKQTVNIGRSPLCDIVEPLPYISARHAMIVQSGGHHYLSDCNSRAGTFLNGEKVGENVLLHDKDHITLCDCSYYLLGNRLLHSRMIRKTHIVREKISNRPMILNVDIDYKRVRDNKGRGMRDLLRDIHLNIQEGTLVALLGTAGAGKTTLMNCLNGMDLTGVKGRVLFRKCDLLDQFERVKYLIGSVPQKKTFHPTFTPEKEFTIAAQKRLPGDTTKEEINERVNKTLEMLSMTDVRNNRNSKLSGGEQTRVNVGIELVADRDMLCLDEPDQGLSPNYKHELFTILQNLAHKNGKTVLAIIHDVSEIDAFDQIIMLAKVNGVGRLAFSGSPKDARKYFGVEDIKDIYTILERNPEKYVK